MMPSNGTRTHETLRFVFQARFSLHILPILIEVTRDTIGISFYSLIILTPSINMLFTINILFIVSNSIMIKNFYIFPIV